MRLLRRFVGLGCIWAGTVWAESPVTLTIGQPATGTAIPNDFIGLSFEISNVLPDHAGQYQFSAENRPLVNLFLAIGIKSLRIGGGTAEPKSGSATEDAKYPIPGPKDIDRLFAFAHAADVQVIYTLRLLRGNQRDAVAIAQYIADHYKSRLDSFSLGNEPDWHAYHTYPGHVLDAAIYETTPGVPGTAYPSYLAKWREFAAAILKAVPDARFSGPDTGSNYPVAGGKDTGYNGRSWTENFAADEKNSGIVTAVLAHDYVGQSAQDVSVQTAVDAMLSPNWVHVNYPALYDRVLAPVQATGLSYRMTECNDYTGGVDGASNAFASALWVLDYMHWHAAHGAAGLNFHNKRWIYTDTIYLDAGGEYKINPKAYGLKAFALGSHGRTAPLAIVNPDHVNLTAYAVVGPANIYITIINKEHDAGARDVTVTLVPPADAAQADAVFLTAPHGDVRGKTGVTLGGATIASNAPWSGAWTSLPGGPAGRFALKVPAASAAVVKLATK